MKETRFFDSANWASDQSTVPYAAGQVDEPLCVAKNRVVYMAFSSV